MADEDIKLAVIALKLPEEQANDKNATQQQKKSILFTGNRIYNIIAESLYKPL